MDIHNEELIEHDLIQGTPEWYSFRLEHDGSSEAAAMLGLSKKIKRTELLHIKHTGIGKEFSDFVQKILDNGHEVEALARPIIERKFDIRLFPLTYSRGRPSASCDGITMDCSIGWEHKQWNKELAESVRNGILPDENWPQVQQALMVTGAEKWIFTVSDGTEDNMVSMEILPDSEKLERIRAGWHQFNKDRAAYVPPEVIQPAVAAPIRDLPAIVYKLTGTALSTNLHEDVKPAILALVEQSKKSLETDQDFADLDALCKKFGEAEKQCALVAGQAVGEIKDVDTFCKDLKELQEIMRQARLTGEKKVASEKDARKVAMVAEANKQYAKHVAGLQNEIPSIRLHLLLKAPDFAGSIKGLKSLASMQDALNNALANEGKVKADAVAKDVRNKLAWCKEHAAGMSMLFPDLQSLIGMEMEAFKAVIENRIAKHKQEEADKVERIRSEEEAKARAKVEAEAKAKAEQEAEEVRAKAVAEIKEREASQGAPQERGRGDVLPDQSVPVVIGVDYAKGVDQTVVHKQRHTDGEVIRAVIIGCEVDNNTACDLIIRCAESLKVAA